MAATFRALSSRSPFRFYLAREILLFSLWCNSLANGIRNARQTTQFVRPFRSLNGRVKILIKCILKCATPTRREKKGEKSGSFRLRIPKCRFAACCNRFPLVKMNKINKWIPLGLHFETINQWRAKKQRNPSKRNIFIGPFSIPFSQTEQATGKLRKKRERNERKSVIIAKRLTLLECVIYVSDRFCACWKWIAST